MIPTAATYKLIRSLLRKRKTDLSLFEDDDSLSAEDLNNLAMLDPALLSEKGDCAGRAESIRSCRTVFAA